MSILSSIKRFGWVTPEQLSASQRRTRAVIRECAERLEGIIMAAQDDFNAQFDRVQTGVQELRDEVARLAALPSDQVDFSRLTELADALASDNIPAEAPPAEPTA